MRSPAALSRRRYSGCSNATKWTRRTAAVGKRSQRSELPGDRPLWNVRAEDAGAQRVVQVRRDRVSTGRARARRIWLVTAPRALSRVARRPRRPPSRRRPRLLGDLLDLVARAGRRPRSPAPVASSRSSRSSSSRLVLGARPPIEHGPRFPCRASVTLRPRRPAAASATRSATWTSTPGGEHASDVVQTLGVPQSEGLAAVRCRPVLALAVKDPGVVRRRFRRREQCYSCGFSRVETRQQRLRLSLRLAALVEFRLVVLRCAR